MKLERARGTRGFWLLESALPSSRLGRFSFAGAGPYAEVRAFGRSCALLPQGEPPPGLEIVPRRVEADPFELLRSVLPRVPSVPDEAPPFAAGAVGWLGYELAASIETLRFQPPEHPPSPDLRFWLVDRVLAFDHESGCLTACALGFGRDAREARERARRRAEALAERVHCDREDPFEAGPAERAEGRGPAAALPPVRLSDPATGLELHGFFDEGSYAKRVGEILEHIAAGNVYQANLTHRLDVAFPGSAASLYRALRQRNPAPFAAFFEDASEAWVGSSPERFLRVDPEGHVESRPIKGTRPRGATPEADRALEQELRASPKDRAENLMIVDLVRNDLGRECRFGSVRAPELFAIERYASVFQAVSTVTGHLRPGRDALHAICAAFPPGSMTGAPKIAAMKLLARLEPVRRGAYSGALGYLDVRGGADLCVVIRSIRLRGGLASLHVGGGVVADSDPVGEWHESLHKARALLDALALAREAGSSPATEPAGPGALR